MNGTLIAIDTQIRSSASELCRGEVTRYIHDGPTWDLLGSAKETFELEAFGTSQFDIEVEIPSDHWDVHDHVVVTDVGIDKKNVLYIMVIA